MNPWGPAIAGLARAAEIQEQRRRWEERVESPAPVFVPPAAPPEPDDHWDRINGEVRQAVEEGQNIREAAKEALFRHGMDAGSLDAFVLVEQRMADGHIRWYYQHRLDAEPPLPTRSVPSMEVCPVCRSAEIQVLTYGDDGQHQEIRSCKNPDCDYLTRYERGRSATLATATLASETAAESQKERSRDLLHFLRFLHPGYSESDSLLTVAAYLESEGE